MAILYTTVAKRADAEQTIERSRFIAHICPVKDRAEADAFFDEIRTAYKDATHNVPAYIIGDKMQLAWASDDGEPQGTSGAPMVQMLKNEGITNVAVIVTRYFGGIKLGPGGLIRAYTSSAKLALEAAGKYEVREYVREELDIPYGVFDKIKYLSENGKFHLISTEFSDKINAVVEYEKDDENEVKKMFSEILKK